MLSTWLTLSVQPKWQAGMFIEFHTSTLSVRAIAQLKSCLESCTDLNDKHGLAHMLHQDAASAAYRFSSMTIKFFWNGPFGDLFTSKYDQPPLLLLHYCTVRRQGPDLDGNRVNWHLDANF